MPTLDAIAYFTSAVETEKQWTRPFSKRVAGYPRNFGEWRLSADGESLDTWKEYREADHLRLSLWDSQGEDIEIPNTGEWTLVLNWPRKAQSLRYRLQASEKIPSARQPHMVLNVSLLEATGADTTADAGEPVEVTLETFSQTSAKGFWVKLLPVSASGALKESDTGEIDISLKQKFLARFNPVFRPGFMFAFESAAYVVQAVSRKDRRRNVTLFCNQIGGESG